MEKGIGIIAIAFLLGCSTTDKIPPKDLDIIQDQQSAIESKHSDYLDWSDQEIGPNGWITDTKCDGLLFNSLYAAIGGDVDPLLAESKQYPGKMFRSPEHDCFEKSLSRSECSRDMYLGYFLWILQSVDKPAIERVVKWGKRNSAADLAWIMCNGQPGAIEFRPNTIDTAKLLLFHLGGPRYHSLIPMQFSKKCDGYECHIQALHVFIRAKIRGWITKKELSFYKTLADRFYKNAFFQLLYARYSGSNIHKSRAGAMLLDTNYFPDDHLPTTVQRCGFYLWERDPSGTSWKPCRDQDKIHSGIDFLIASAMYLDEI